MNGSEIASLLLLALPAGLFLLFGLGWLVGLTPSERLLSRSTIAVHVVLTMLVGTLVYHLETHGRDTLIVDLGTWFSFQEVSIHLSLLVDRLSLTMSALTVTLVGLVAAFSARYMHREQGYLRFFLLMHLFTFGALVLFLAASLDLLFGGWELVGLTSVLLIGYFQRRKEPLRNAISVFAAYRIADLQIVLATVFAHLWLGGASWADLLSGNAAGQVQAPSAAFAILAALLIIGACGKSAQGPFFGWLPRAMDGPTPSSAVFYGAISVHAGAYLLLRVQPLIAGSTTSVALLTTLGALTAVVATIVQRTRSDAKTSLAYAVQTQLGLIMIEIALGWTTIALLHITGHALLRTMQFLRAPSLLHDQHGIRAAASGHALPSDPIFGTLPRGLGTALYRFSMSQGHYDALIDRLSWKRTRTATLITGALAVVIVSFGAADNGHTHQVSIWSILSAIGTLVSIIGALWAFAKRKPRRVVGSVLCSVGGMALAGITSGEPKGVVGGVLTGAMLLLAATGLSAVLHGLEARTHLAVDPRDNLGLGARAPRLSLFFLVFSLALVGIPGTLGFVAEDLLFHGALHTMPLMGILLPLSTALNAIHLLRIWHRLFNGRQLKDVAAIPDALPREGLLMIGCTIALILAGLVPDPVIDGITPLAERITHLISSPH